GALSLLRFLCRYKEMKPQGGGTSLDYKDNNSESISATTDWYRAYFLPTKRRPTKRRPTKKAKPKFRFFKVFDG
ncbi:MAG: hypothetical protein ACI9W6_001954, partial [Motiliproteus sp.]